MERIDWPKKYKDAYDHAQRDLDEKAKKSIIDGAFFGAAAYAKRSAKNDGFYPEPDENGETTYAVQQGLRAACYSREEIAAVLVIQKTIIRGISALIAFAAVSVSLLVYVALQVS